MTNDQASVARIAPSIRRIRLGASMLDDARARAQRAQAQAAALDDALDDERATALRLEVDALARDLEAIANQLPAPFDDD